jgi:hypothetical protein
MTSSISIIFWRLNLFPLCALAHEVFPTEEKGRAPRARPALILEYCSTSIRVLVAALHCMKCREMRGGYFEIACSHSIYFIG